MPIFVDLEEALDRGELFVEYLPTVTLADACCVGGEALACWRRGENILPAALFIPLIENTPLSGRITYRVIDTVALELSEWLAAHADAHISINVPPEILGRGGLAYAADHSGLRALNSQIVLEITERSVPDTLGLKSLNLMAQRGMRLALDGTSLTGANLALMARGNFSTIKLDGTVTSQLKPNKPPPEWLAGLASLLKSSSLQVVAEGVESNFQAQALRAAGVQMAQGYLYSPPLPARGLVDFYARNREAVH